jgi:hypothetical protein
VANGSFGVSFHIGELIKIPKRENYTVDTQQKIENKKSAKRRVLCRCLVTAYVLAVRGRTLQTPYSIYQIYINKAKLFTPQKSTLPVLGFLGKKW